MKKKLYFMRRRYLPLIAAIDAAGKAYLKMKYFFIKPKKFDKNNVNKIVLLILDLIGDGILATAAIRMIRENFPKAEITVFAGAWNRQIFENNANVDIVKIIDPFWTISTNLGFWERFKKYYKLFKDIEKGEYDLGIDLRGEFLSILLMKKMGVKYAAGYGITGGGWLLDKCADYEGDRFAKHTVERSLGLLKAIGLQISGNLDLEIYTNKENKQAVDKFFKDNEIFESDKIALIHPFSNDQARCWDNERWAEVAGRLIENGYKVILSGGPNDEKVIKFIKSKVENQISKKIPKFQNSKIPNKNLILNTKYLIQFLGFSILDFAELVKRADLLLCVNSAALHIGAAAKTPTVVLFAGSFPKTYGPWQNKNSVVLFKDAQCFPCGLKKCKNNVCMLEITVEEVISAAKKCAETRK